MILIPTYLQVFSMLLCCFSVAELIYALTEDNVPTVDYVAPLIMIITYVSIIIIEMILIMFIIDIFKLQNPNKFNRL